MANRPDWLDGDGLLAKYRADPVHMGFFGIAEDDAAWGPWLDGTPPDDRQPIIVAVHGLSITYRKNRNITAARKWANIHLRLARSLPEGFGPGKAVSASDATDTSQMLCGVCSGWNRSAARSNAHITFCLSRNVISMPKKKSGRGMGSRRGRLQSAFSAWAQFAPSCMKA